MSNGVLQANGYAHAYSTWIARGDGLDTKRDGVFRYKAGPMKGMTRDQAQMEFQNNVWRSAPDKWKDEYARRATEGLLSPSEQKAQKEAQKAQTTSVTQPQYRTQTAQSTTDNSPAAATTSKGSTLNRRVDLPGEDGSILAGPPAPEEQKASTKSRFKRNEAAAKHRNAKRVAQTVEKMVHEPYGDSPAGRFDLMKADYSTLTPNQKAQRTDINVYRAKEKEASMGTPEKMPAMTVTAPQYKPLETKFDVAKGRIVQTGGEADEAYTAYDDAQKATHAGTADEKQRQTVMDYNNDVLGRQPHQVAKLREEERKGYYQAGRYVGPQGGRSATAAPASPTTVSPPRFTHRLKSANPAPVATRQPTFGNRSGTGASRRPF